MCWAFNFFYIFFAYNFLPGVSPINSCPASPSRDVYPHPWEWVGGVDKGCVRYFVSAYTNSCSAACCDIPGCVHSSLGTCTDTQGHRAICTSCCLWCLPGRYRIDPCGVQELSVSTGILGGMTKCKGQEWCRTFHMKLCKDPQASLTPLTSPKSLCECKAGSLPCSHLSPQCPMSFIQSAWGKVLLSVGSAQVTVMS